MSASPKPERRNMGLAWVENVPEHWAVQRLKTKVDCLVSNVDKIPSKNETPVRLCNYTDVYRNEYITSDMPFMKGTATESEIQRFGLNVGDVLLTKDSESWDDIAVPALVCDTASDLVCGYHLAIMRPFDNALLSPFLLRVLQSRPINQQFQLASTGVTRYGLPKSAIGEAFVPFPPRREQEVIVKYIDNEIARIDELIAEKESMLKLLDEKRSALIAKAVTRGIDPDAEMKDSGIEWLGEIPVQWNLIRLNCLAEELQTGPFGSQLHAEDYVSEGVPVINPTDIVAGKILPHKAAKVDKTTVCRLTKHTLKESDVIFARRGELGRCAVVKKDQTGWLCGTGSLRVRLNQFLMHPEFLVAYVQYSGASDQLCLESVGSTMDNLNTTILGNLVIAVPTMVEQKKIIGFLGDEIRGILEIQSVLNESSALLKERRSALIEAAVTGQIDMERMSA